MIACEQVYKRSSSCCCTFKTILTILVTILTLVILGLILLLFLLIFAPCLVKDCRYSVKSKINCPRGYQGDHCDECGLTFRTHNSEKIVGGSTAEPNSWPSIAAITVYSSDSNQSAQFLCGGVLIDRKTVLSAAHCFYEDSKFLHLEETLALYNVRLGLHDRRQLNAGRHAMNVPVQRITLHPHYDPLFVQNDIAVVQLAYEVDLSEQVQIACLPQPTRQSGVAFPAPGQLSWSAGWGTTAFMGNLSDVLQNVKVTVYDMSRCSGVLPKLEKNPQSQICAGELHGGKDSCQGDSGGPLYAMGVIGSKFKYVIAGIVSFGEECALPHKPGLYTRISHFIPWIEQHM